MSLSLFSISARAGRLLVIFLVALALMLALITVLAPASQAQVDAPTTHTVSRGETLSEIAEQYEVDMRQLMALNGILTPDAIYIGQTLTLPAPAPTATSTPTSTATLTADDAASDAATPTVAAPEAPLPAETSTNAGAAPPGASATPALDASEAATSTATADPTETTTPTCHTHCHPHGDRHGDCHRAPARRSQRLLAQPRPHRFERRDPQRPRGLLRHECRCAALAQRPGPRRFPARGGGADCARLPPDAAQRGRG